MSAYTHTLALMPSTTAPMAAASTNKARLEDDGTQLTYNETIDALCGFIKTAIYTILCHRQVYPPNVFTRRQRYRVPVWASRHPGLNAYVDDVVGAVKVQIQKNTVRSVHVVLTSTSSGAVLERYRFDIDFILSNVPTRDRDFSIPGNMTMQAIELQLRAFMMKLISLDGALYDIEQPEDVTWALVLDMKEGCEPQSGDTKGNEPAQGPWVPFDEGRFEGPDEADNGASEEAGSSGERPAYLHARPRWPGASDGSEDDDAQIVPIKSLDTGVINLMLYVEEHPSAKRKANVGRTAKPSSEKAAMPRRRRTQQDEEAAEASRTGERDIDQPLPQPSSSGLPKKAGKVKRKKAVTGQSVEGDQDEASEASESSRSESDSGDSIRSVNDFAGYGKGPGGVGMSGVGM